LVPVDYQHIIRAPGQFSDIRAATEIRRSIERGHIERGWLESYHSFSFADYSDPLHMHFGALRAINEDRMQPGTGFGTHGHRDMEIVTYAVSGTLSYRSGNDDAWEIHPGDVQRLSAGQGVFHEEYNPSSCEEAHFFHIWILPKSSGTAPNCVRAHFNIDAKRGRFAIVASPDGRDGSLSIQQDIALYAGLFHGCERTLHDVAPGRRTYVHVVKGAVTVNGNRLGAGDAFKAANVRQITVEAGSNAEILLFDLA
jgi:quercetin 2,3-dioxygenase